MDSSYLWNLTAAGLAFLLPAGLVLVAVSGVSAQRVWDAALGGMAAFCLAGLGYWATGFAFQFGSVGFLYTDHPELSGLLRGWSPLPEGWGVGWIAAGLDGWFLSGPAATPGAMGLFLAHVPWSMTAALLPVLALRGRAPALATLVVALVVGAFVYPLAGNWVQGGGWLAALGSNAGLGHGLVDFGGGGTVFLVSASASLAALLVWPPRQRARSHPVDSDLPTVHLPLLAVVGSLFVMAGVLAWVWTGPVQQPGTTAYTAMRTAVNGLLYATGGVTVPLLYTWFVTGTSDPGMSARGLVAGVVAGLAAGPFPGHAGALVTGLLAGGSVPFVTYAVHRVFGLDDGAGIFATAGIPAAMGLMCVSIFADGAAGAGWQQVGAGSYLGVAGQGVTGLLAAPGFQSSFFGQFQAQMIGIVALGLWGFVSCSIICVPLGLFFYGFGRAVRSDEYVSQQGPTRAGQQYWSEGTNVGREDAPFSQEMAARPPSEMQAEEPRFR
ncbi:MAG: hypothetical protein OXO50_24340 [Caldilineaceae bacterium]|nr:hypothetical protein [Caldilineaceae bacterium]